MLQIQSIKHKRLLLLLIRRCPLLIQRISLSVRRLSLLIRRIPLSVRRLSLLIQRIPLSVRTLSLLIRRFPLSLIFAGGLIIAFPLLTSAQKDSTTKNKLDGFITSRKGLFGKIVRNLLADTAETQLQRNDVRYQRFKGATIRKINIKVLNFGTALTDTNNIYSNSAINFANVLHRKTREYVIHNNLFFRTGQKIQPFLIADN